MPSVFDRAKPLIDFDPLVNKLNFDIGDWEQGIVDAAEDAFLKFIDDLILAIGHWLGIDLSAWIAVINIIITSLGELFGELNPLSGTFDPGAAIMTLFNLAVTLAALSPALLASLQSLATTGLAHLLLGFATGPLAGPILTQLIDAMGGVGNTLGDLNTIFIRFNNIMTSLGVLFGELNFLAPDFNPADAILAFINLILTIISSAPDVLVALQDLITAGLTGVLSLSTWTSFLTGAIGILGGTGSTVSDLLAALGFIPAANIVGGLSNATIAAGNIIGTLAQALIPSLTSGWGGTIDVAALVGTLAQTLIPTLTGTWGGTIASSLLNGVLVQGIIPALTSGWGGSIASSLLSGALSQTLIPALTSGWGGSIASSLLSGVASQSIIPNLTSGWGGSIAASVLTGTISTAVAPWAASIDTLMNAWGATGSGFSLANLATKAAAIPPANVVGHVSADIGQDIQQLISAVTTGAGNSSIPGTLANLTAQINGIASLLGYQPAADPPATSTSGIAQTQAAFTAMRAATRPTFLALADSTGDVTFPFPLVGTSATTIPVTQAVPAIGSIGTTDGGVAGTDPTTWPLKKSISFVCSKSGTVNGIYLTIYRVNVTTGATTWVHTSPNQAAGVSGGMNRYYYNMTNVANYVPVGQNEYYQIEMRIYGPGTINLVGIPNSYAPANTVGFPTHIGATRTPPNLYSVASNSGATAKNPSWTLTTVAGDNCILVNAVAYSTTSNVTAITATCGGVAMTQKTFKIYTTIATDAQSAVMAQFELHNTAFAAFSAGAKTIAITTTGGGTSGTQCAVQANAVSYQNISAVDAGTVINGSGASMTQTVTGLTADSPVILHSFMANAVSDFTSGNQNVIALILGSSFTEPFMVQDQFAYATSVPFTGTFTSGTGKWAASVVQLTSSLANLVAPVGGVAAPGFTPSSNLPWFMFGGAAGVSGAAVATHQPTLQTFTSSGHYTRKSWAKFYDIITCSGAGGGANGDNFVGGYPGAAGIWNSVTLTAADVAGDASWDVTVGNGGLGGSGGTALAASGFAGGDSYVDIGGYGTAAYTPGSVGGTSNNGTVAGSPGGGPGDITVNDEPYYGGSGGASAQASGTQPGGSGAGGNAFFSGNNIYGGNGAPGIVYILARQ